MAPLIEDDTVRRIDTIMERSGLSRDRMHVTGKRLENLPDLLVYSRESVGSGVTVGLEEWESDEGVRTKVKATFPNKASLEWDSLEAFENEIDDVAAERLS